MYYIYTQYIYTHIYIIYILYTHTSILGMSNYKMKYKSITYSTIKNNHTLRDKTGNVL